MQIIRVEVLKITDERERCHTRCVEVVAKWRSVIKT